VKPRNHVILALIKRKGYGAHVLKEKAKRNRERRDLEKIVKKIEKDDSN